MGHTTAWLTGLARYLVDADIDLTYRTDGRYEADETGIVFGQMPATPDRVVVLTPYTVSGSARSDGTQGVQIRARAPGGPLPVLDLTDVIYDVLHGARDLNLGGVLTPLIWRASLANLGPDQNRRHETSSNYYFQLAHPSAHTTD